MLIDTVFPNVVGARMALEQGLRMRCDALAIPDPSALVGMLCPPLSDAVCFRDELAGVYRYEFGVPYKKGRTTLYGPHVWPQVDSLVEVLHICRQHLSHEQIGAFVHRLNPPAKHAATLAEVLPVLRVDSDVQCSFNYRTGVGEHDVEWKIEKPGCVPLLVEVKRRSFDILALSQQITAGARRGDGHGPKPIHDANLLFRSVEKKYATRSPDDQLQGVWVWTGLQQSPADVQQAFDNLDVTKVHYAVIGGSTGLIWVLTRRVHDREIILEVLGRLDQT
ncbi:MAG: hypothetical protein AB7K71_29100 [Polyangiaceae bacterium]